MIRSTTSGKAGKAVYVGIDTHNRSGSSGAFSPDGQYFVADQDVRNALGLIRLITRLIFVWFIKEKGLVPDDLFNKRKVDELIKYGDPRGSTYYKAVLQNLPA